MARAYKCDRCGAFYDCNTDRKITTRRYDSISAQREHDDLCEKCTQELMEWFAAGEDGDYNERIDRKASGSVFSL